MPCLGSLNWALMISVTSSVLFSRRSSWVSNRRSTTPSRSGRSATEPERQQAAQQQRGQDTEATKHGERLPCRKEGERSAAQRGSVGRLVLVDILAVDQRARAYAHHRLRAFSAAQVVDGDLHGQPALLGGVLQDGGVESDPRGWPRTLRACR